MPNPRDCDYVDVRTSLHESWFRNVDRGDAENELYRLGKEGSFIVRPSSQSSAEHPYSLSIYHDGEVHHIMLSASSGKYYVGVEKPELTFASVKELIQYHTCHPLITASGNVTLNEAPSTSDYEVIARADKPAKFERPPRPPSEDPPPLPRRSILVASKSLPTGPSSIISPRNGSAFTSPRGSIDTDSTPDLSTPRGSFGDVTADIGDRRSYLENPLPVHSSVRRSHSDAKLDSPNLMNELHIAIHRRFSRDTGTSDYERPLPVPPVPPVPPISLSQQPSQGRQRTGFQQVAEHQPPMPPRRPGHPNAPPARPS